MKKLFLLIFIFSVHGLFAQKLSLTVTGGTTIYAGDLQLGNFTIHPSNYAVGAGINYKLTPHISAGANIMYGSIYANDSNVSETFKQRRNLSFRTKLFETNLQVQYDVFAIDQANQFTPYFFAGIGVFHFNPYTFDRNGTKTYLQPLGTEGQGLPQYPDRKIYSLTQINIPFGMGIKYNLTDRISVGFEISFRKLFTDYLDDVSTRYPDSLILLNARGPEAVDLSFRGDESKPPFPFPSPGDVRGNPSRKDTYRFILFRFSYTLQDLNFSGGNGSSSSRSRKQTGCPKKVF